MRLLRQACLFSEIQWVYPLKLVHLYHCSQSSLSVCREKGCWFYPHLGPFICVSFLSILSWQDAHHHVKVVGTLVNIVIIIALTDPLHELRIIHVIYSYNGTHIMVMYENNMENSASLRYLTDEHYQFSGWLTTIAAVFAADLFMTRFPAIAAPRGGEYWCIVWSLISTCWIQMRGRSCQFQWSKRNIYLLIDVDCKLAWLLQIMLIVVNKNKNHIIILSNITTKIIPLCLPYYYIIELHQLCLISHCRNHCPQCKLI